MTKKMSPQEAGRKGGNATLAKYSREFYSNLGKKSKTDPKTVDFRKDEK